MLTTIPFAGFYYSIHDQEIDSTLERMFSDRATGCHANKDLQMHAWESCDWHAVQVAYAQAYAHAFAAEFKLDSLTFDELSSPREYNFTTDRIFVDVSESDARRMLDECDPITLAKHARERFTSRSGFISFYSADVGTWGDLEEWDHNQLGTLVSAYVEAFTGDDFDSYAEHSLMSSSFENGYMDRWIEDATPTIARLYRIHDYLEDRAER